VAAAAGLVAVSGKLTLASGAIYLVQVNPSTSSLANVTGTASLNGTVNANFANGSYISKVYTILTAGSVTGTFASVVNSNLPSNFHDSLSYDATHAYLDLTLNYTPPSAPSYTPLNVNESTVANTLTNYFNTTGGIPTIFGTLTPAGLTQTDGENGTGAERGASEHDGKERHRKAIRANSHIGLPVGATG
jgi:hypothetical protein